MEQPGPARRQPRKLQRRLDGLGAAVREEHHLEAIGRDRDQFFRQPRRQRIDGTLSKTRRLVLHRPRQLLDDPRMIVSQVGGAEAGDEVDVLIAGRVPQDDCPARE